MPALWIAHVTVTDEAAYGRYAALAGPAIAAHGGAFIARGGRYVQLEGTERARNVVARFEPEPRGGRSLLPQRGLSGRARACARPASERELVIVETTD